MSNYMGLQPTLMTDAPAAAEVAHDAGGLPQFDPTWWPSQLFWLAICFAVLYFVFSRSTLPRLGGILESRALRIENDMKAAEALSAQADQVKTEYEQALKKASAAAAETIKATDTAAKAKLTTALADFRTRFDSEIAATEARLTKSASAAMQDMNRIAAEVAAQAAEKIAGIPADQSQAESVVASLNAKAKAA